jgi:hypothetical protein
MRNLFTLPAVGLLLLLVEFGCRAKPAPIIEIHPHFFLTGTYVDAEETRYSLTWDTIFVKHPVGSSFQVIRRAKCSWKSPSKSKPTYQYLTAWTGTTEGISNKLFLSGRTDGISFDPENLDGLYFEGRTYHKIEN